MSCRVCCARSIVARAIVHSRHVLFALRRCLFRSLSVSLPLPPSAQLRRSAQYAKGARVERLLVLEINEQTGVVRVTRKPMLLDAVEQSTTLTTEEDRDEDVTTTVIVPRDVNELTDGQLVAGYVVSVRDFGVFVRFCGGLTALAPKALLSDSFTEDPSSLFAEGDSLIATVDTVKPENGRIVVSTKPSRVSSRATRATFLRSLLAEV